ncbi:MAG: hypothetical protein LBV58_00455 [Acholeplasmatales bacterium]|jgi:hypothetical protein|nr:hypothetical protein [Acholeplasmatales bacterium]
MDKCGFFVVLTNDFDIQHSLMLTSMRNKYKVELNFRQHKTDFDNEKARIQSDEVLLSKTFISFISSIIKFELLNELEPFLHNPKYSSYTLNSVLGTRNKLEIRKNGKVWKPTKRLTGRQETILKTAKLDQIKLFKTMSQIKH